MLYEIINQHYKGFLYRFFYMESLFRYMFKKVPIDFFEVWIGQRCTLRCKECCHLIPYVESVIYDADTVIKDCVKFLMLCEIKFFSIVGGEPFSHPELYRVIDFVASRADIPDGKIVTNGTIIPDDRTIESLKALNGKFEVRIDMYPGKEEISTKFYNILLEAGIRCHLSHYTDWQWKELGGPNQERLSIKKTKDVFLECWDKRCYTLSNGEFTACPRGILSERVYGIPKRKFENIHLSKLKGNTAAKAMIATCMSHKVYKDYCQYCLGMTKTNTTHVTPGVQLDSHGTGRSV